MHESDSVVAKFRIVPHVSTNFKRHARKFISAEKYYGEKRVDR